MMFMQTSILAVSVGARHRFMGACSAGCIFISTHLPRGKT
jgi:hypothetical protein